MFGKIGRLSLFGPLAVAGFIALALLVAGCFMLARTVDRLSREREEAVILNGLSARQLELEKSVAANLVWDDAVKNLDNAYDDGWARENVGMFFESTQGIGKSFVLDGDNRLFFSSTEGKQTGAAAFDPFKGAVAAAIRNVRRDERVRTQSGHQGGTLGHPIQSSTTAIVNGMPYILTATLVQPDFGKSSISGPRAPVVVTGRGIDADFLGGLASRYMLAGLHLEKGQSYKAGEAKVALSNDRGVQIATLGWQPQAPGTALMTKLALPMFALISAFIATLAILSRRSWKNARSLIASEARASHLAYHDHLTGLPNRVLFFDRLGIALDQARRTGRTVAVHCIDLDRFKEVNDTFGHQIGDELIRYAAERLASACRRGDTVARLSGDEFAIVQVEATPRRAARFAARLVEGMSQPANLSSGRIFTGCSVGTTLVAGGDIEPVEVMRHADLALYRAKQSGRGQYRFFEPEMDAALQFRRAIENDLRQALAEGDLQMVYQPQSDRRGSMVGVEALVRWRHPERGEISPAFFVPIAEECGLIAELGLFTLRRAFEDSRRWPGLRVAINVSASQLRLKDFLSRLRELVEEMHVDPRQFELEITEGLLLGDDPVTHETLAQIRTMGFSIALDDFGTGYSSLSYLQQYPIDKIKIDRSFIKNLGVEREAEAVVAAIVKLARALNLRVIAEGVETEDQLRCLLAVGCGETQGYLLSKPIAAEEIDFLNNFAEAA
ncbi:MAG: EAL domain-containing protein [Sphingomonadaceae bacterium]